jgi:hypothetical protein
MKRASWLLLAAALIVGNVESFSSKAWTVRGVQAQGNQRLVTESLGITSGQYLVADLGVFPDGMTKLILRDPHGRLGLVLAVSDRTGAERAEIQFFDAGGQLMRTINATSAGSPLATSSGGQLEYRMQRLEDLALPRTVLGPGERQTQSNELNVWNKIEQLERRIQGLERSR